ncbi:organelle RRM domain-containing protein 6, chloroplastic-like [Impatiens glandulifera]|uniref:organelle RRM domain-containing protein 6, chloroplastic-like n=1 Tax=Impatiens glandulifera TaxID=253017 RepID=UPI001FB0FF0A|nr:organelle RRM domain-containing protein 6, chloroplastic-like [Impatiens glandulifera]
MSRARNQAVNLFISRLSFYTNKEDLRNMFLPFGNILEARLVNDPKTGRHKGFGFVKFESEIEASNAIKAMNGRIVEGRLIFVEVANPEKEDAGDAR